MPVSLTCTGCSRTLRVPDRLAGRQVRCPKCQQINSVPSLADAFDAEFEAPARRPKAKEPRRPAVPRAPAEDESTFLQAPEPEQGDGDSFSAIDDAPEASRLPPRIAGVKKRRKTFKTAVDEPGPKRQQYSEFKPIEAEPANSRDHLFFIFALALIPLAISVFFPQPTIIDRAIERMHDNGAEGEEFNEEEFAELIADEVETGGLEAHLAADSWMHWGYAGLALIMFLGLLVAICGRSASPWKLLSTGLMTGTIGIVMLLAIQWIALSTRFLWLRGGGLAFIVFMIVKLIGYSYYCALDPNSGFLASFFGFTFGVGLCEELCKAIPVLWYVNSPQSNWKGAMLVGMASGIGFGISEGISYSSDFYNGFAGGQIYLVRFTSCVTLHAVWAGAVGLIMFSDQTYCSDLDWEAALMFVVKYLSIAMILHGLYDVLLKKELEVGALVVAVASWMWLARLFYQRRTVEMQAA